MSSRPRHDGKSSGNFASLMYKLAGRHAAIGELHNSRLDANHKPELLGPQHPVSI